MTRARLTIDLDAIIANWRALDALSAPNVETSAVLKADAYGLGAVPIGNAVASAGVKTFFVALAEEGSDLRAAIGPDPRIFLLNGYIPSDRDLIVNNTLIPILCSPEQIARFRESIPSHPCALQIDIGMNRMGLKPLELASLFPILPTLNIQLILGHLSCSDDPLSPFNPAQLATFHALTTLLALYPRSLAATGGILLGASYHFALTRPGIGLFGGHPFAKANPVVTLTAPILQIRDVLPGESIGYGAAFTATQPMRIATIAAGYADGLPRALGGKANFYAGNIPCPIIGRVSMDLITLDVTHLHKVPDQIEILGPSQSIVLLSAAAGTVGYEILTSLGTRFDRHYKGG